MFAHEIHELTEAYKTIKALRLFGKDRRAVTAMEYGLLAALVGVAAAAALRTVGSSLVTEFTTINTSLQ